MSGVSAFENKLPYKALRVILYASLLTPLWVWSIFLFPFITTKILYFRLLVEAALFLYLILALQYPELRPRWNWLTRAVWIYVGAVFLTSLFGLNFGNSFWGTIERGEGIITLLHFAVYFTILSAVFRTRTDWYKYLLVALSVITLVAVYGLLQFACQGHQPGSPSNSVCDFVLTTTGSRISGTIGNAAFFAAFLLFGVFLSWYLFNQLKTERIYFSNLQVAALASAFPLFQFLETGSGAAFFLFLIISFLVFGLSLKLVRPALIGALVLEVFVLYNTQTRGALLALVLALLAYFAFAVFKSEQRKFRLISLVLLLVLIGGSLLVYASREAGWVKANATLRRLATISPSDITTQSRLDTWQASWQGWQDRFVTGYGYENYNLAFNKYFPARIFKDSGSQVWFDRAHNVVFDVALNSGLLGLLVYLAIFIFAGRVLWKLYRKRLAQLPWQSVLILGLVLAAYFLQNLFVFDTQATYLMFFLVLAHFSFLHNEFLTEPEPQPQSQNGYEPGFIFSAVLAVIVFVGAYFVNLEPAFANHQATEGIKLAALKQFREVGPAFKKSLSYGTYMDEEIRQRLVDHVFEAINSGQLSSQEQQELFQYAIDELNKSLRESPHDVKNYIYLMNAYNRFGVNQAAIEEVIALGEKALVLSPTRSQIYFELGQVYFNKNDPETGLVQFRKGVELNPDTKEAHMNYLFALILARLEEAAEEELRVITENKGIALNSGDYQNIARAYLQVKDYPRAIENFLQAAELSPASPDLHARIAAVYGEICDQEGARRHVEEAVKLNSGFALEGGQFLRELEARCQN